MTDSPLTRRERQVLKIIAATPQRVTYRNPSGRNGGGYLHLAPSGEHIAQGTLDVLCRRRLVHYSADDIVSAS